MFCQCLLSKHFDQGRRIGHVNSFLIKVLLQLCFQKSPAQSLTDKKVDPRFFPGF
jgi:hypothetical protein